MTARLATLLWLVVVWVALWESVTVANVLSGFAVGSLLVAFFPVRRAREGTGRVRPLATLQLLGYFLAKLVEANAVVAWEVITPSNASVTEGIVAVPLAETSDSVVALVANAISLTPGTLTLEVERNPTVLYIHVLHLRSIAQVHIDVLSFERYVHRAIGTSEGVADVERRLEEARIRQRNETSGEAP